MAKLIKEKEIGKTKNNRIVEFIGYIHLKDFMHPFLATLVFKLYNYGNLASYSKEVNKNNQKHWEKIKNGEHLYLYEDDLDMVKMKWQNEITQLFRIANQIALGFYTFEIIFLKDDNF